MSSFLIVPLAALVFLLLGLRVVEKKERVSIMRLGRFLGVRGPGVVWVLPCLDRTTRINLDRDLPYWPSLSTGKLNATSSGDAYRSFSRRATQMSSPVPGFGAAK